MANVVTFPAGAKVFVQSFANAGYQQQVTIKPPTGAPAIFTGAGEGNIPLNLTTPGFLTSGKGWPSFTAVSGNYIVTVNANGKPTPVAAYEATGATPTGGTAIVAEVVSEDSTDKDFNDSITLFTANLRPVS